MVIKFDTDNEAFNDTAFSFEVARILGKISQKVNDGYVDGTIHDINGNTVGAWEL